MHCSHDLGSKRAEIRAAAAVYGAIEAKMTALIAPLQNGHGSRRLMEGEARHDMPFVAIPPVCSNAHSG